MATYATKNDVQGVVDKALDTYTLTLIKYLDKQFGAIDKELAAMNQKYDWLVQTLDKFLKRLDDGEANDLARDAQLARQERWIHQIAQETGVKLTLE